MIVYLSGQYLPKEQAVVSPDDRGFVLGDGVYEAIRAFDGYLFRSHAHWQRLRRSLSAIGISDDVGHEAETIAGTLLEKNDLRQGEATVYFQVTRGVAPRQHAFPQPPVPPTVYACAARFNPPQKKWETGVSVLLVPDQRWTRCDIKAISLLPNVLANQQAHAAGADEALLVREGVITEGSRSNFAAVRNGTFFTHPEGPHILSGITRAVALELCAALGIPVREPRVRDSESGRFEEAMLLGTRSDVMPVVRINGEPIGNGQPGHVTRRLQTAFRELVEREKAAGVRRPVLLS